MDEKHYKKTYSNINPQRCVFEKSINSRVCNCSKSQRFNLADREGVACSSAASLNRCDVLLTCLHNNARFALQQIDVSELGHAQEIKIQNGGLLGLQREFQEHQQVQENVADIDAIITNAEKKFNAVEHFPFSNIMQVVSAYQIRPKRKRLKKD
ncbi:MAG: hypothetical protein ACRBDX_07665 [Gammaproteobacteria bacterium]